jgi:hypothetical protein
VKQRLASKFDIKDLGRLTYFLGMSAIQDQEALSTWNGQPAYIEKLLTKGNCKPVGTSVDPGKHLLKTTEDEEAVEQQLYRSLVMYLSVSSKPNKSHWRTAKRVLRYLKGSANHGIAFTKSESGECLDQEDREVHKFQMAGGRKSGKQNVALSTAEAEYIALSSAAQETVWIRRLITELGNEPEGPTTLMEDNQSAIAMAKNLQFHGHAKHSSPLQSMEKNQASLVTWWPTC